MSVRPGRTKSKEMTWSEKELAKHMLDKRRTSATADGSSKSSPKAGQKLQAGTSGAVKSGLSSTVPAKRGAEVKKGGGGGKDRLSSTVAAGSLSPSGSRGSGARDAKKGSAKGSSSLSSQARSKENRETGERREERRREDVRRGRERTERGGGRDSRRGREEAGKKERDPREREEREGEKEDRGRRREKERGREKEGRGKEGEKNARISSSSTGGKPRISPEMDRKPPAGPIPQPMEEVKDGDAVEEDFEYDEEFEEDDYVDDFEEDIEEHTESEDFSDDVIAKSPPATNPDLSSTDRIDLVEIMQAIDAENKDVTRPLHLEPTPSLGIGTTSSQGSQRSMGHRKFVDFSSAKKTEERERVARVTKKRGQELLSMIELDVVTFDLFDLRPLSEYEVYMRSFGSSGTRQAGSQTGEDTVEEGTQTEEVERREKWVQWPPEDLKGFGGPDGEEREETGVEGDTGSAVRLASFLKRASQVVSVLLEENAAQNDVSQTHSNQSPIPFCSTRMKIELPKELRGCTLTSVEYSHAHPHLIMSIHSPAARQDEGEGPVPKGGGAICVWSTREPSQPQFYLVSQSPSVCSSFGPIRTPLVFCGTEDGCVLLWDLRETVAMHTRPPGVATPTSHTHIPRPPTFSTAALPQKYSHQSPIVSLSPITTSTPHNSPSSHLLTDDESATIGLSFQLASLDRSGLLIIWVAVETKPHPQGSESDLGLIPNGRVKLVWGAALDTMRSSPDSIPVQTLCVRFHSTDTNHIFLGTDEGTVVHCTRYSRRPIPRLYRSHCPCDVTSLSFSPWQPDYFLASYSNGNISLYNIKKANPLVVWTESTNGIAVSKVEWAWHIPGVFLALDGHSTLYLWNLTDNDRGPTHFYSPGKGGPAILSFSLSPSPSPSIALCLSNSTVEIHQLSAPADSDTLEKPWLPNFTNYTSTVCSSSL